eukprot:TRINITY_DN16412_c0_g1_i1.p2 TRINITY_DN16412_c0_g1~~TRINITY_DN16412_c0_g1_i1.p2  ORF type:complete len:217 (+),score=12.01 TRINITY_DN16412_c0_g1_i1:59-709(+)
MSKLPNYRKDYYGVPLEIDLLVLKEWMHSRSYGPPKGDDLTAAKERLDARLDVRRFRTVERRGDTNCQFRAVVCGANPKLIPDKSAAETAACEARKDAVEYIKKHRSDFAPYINGGAAGFNNYIKTMSTAFAWGDPLTLYALACIYDKTIEVITSLPSDEHRVLVPDGATQPADISLGLLGQLSYSLLERDAESNARRLFPDEVRDVVLNSPLTAY